MILLNISIIVSKSHLNIINWYSLLAIICVASYDAYYKVYFNDKVYKIVCVCYKINNCN
jgi:hypothetical protein